MPSIDNNKSKPKPRGSVPSRPPGLPGPQGPQRRRRTNRNTLLRVPQPPALVRNYGRNQKQNGRNRKHPISIDWKLACSDAPTRATRDYLTSTLTHLSGGGHPSPHAGEFSKDTLFVYAPTLAEAQYAMFNDADINTVVGTVPRTVISNASTKRQAAIPSMVSLMAVGERVSLVSASLTILSKFPNASGILHIRRATQLDMNSTVGQLRDSLVSDMVSTYHIDLEDKQRHTFNCGVHNTESVGNLSNATAADFHFTTTGSVGALIWRFTEIQSGTAIAAPALHISMSGYWTEELTPLVAHVRDNAPERSVVALKSLHAGQARLGPVPGLQHETPKAVLAGMNSLRHGAEMVQSITSTGASLLEAGASTVQNIKGMRSNIAILAEGASAARIALL